MRQFEFHAARDHLRLFEHFLDGIDRPVGDTCVIEQLDPLLGRALFEHRVEQSRDLDAVFHALGIDRKTRILGQMGAARRLAKLVEQVVVAAGENDGAVFGRKGLIGHDIRMRVTDARRRLTGGKVVHRLIGKKSDTAIEQGNVDPLPLAGDRAVGQRRTDRDAGVHPRGHVDDRNADTLRTAAGHAVGLAGDAHQTAHALRHEVVTGPVLVRTGLAETGNRAVNQSGIELGQIVITQTVARQITHLVIFHQHVNAFRQLAYQLLSLRLAQVHRDRFLAAIGGAEIGTLLRLAALFVFQERRGVGARIIALAGTLHLDHLRPQIGEVLCGPRSREYAGKVQYFDMR